MRAVLRNYAVWVAAFGYFVDLYDLILFGVVRVASLKSLSVPSDRMLEVGALLLNAQMGGMLLGGFLWGVLADKRGRLSVLFGSILLYSAANVANAFVTTIPLYAALRFLAGVGLAGELGVAVTLVSEILPVSVRGYGSTLIAIMGFLGGITATLVGGLAPWPWAYAIGGALGFALLAARMRLNESPLFRSIIEHERPRGSLRLLFASRERALRFLRCILIGFPIWFCTGILLYFAPELARELGIQGAVTAGNAIMGNYFGAVLGDVLAILLSQHWQSRKRVITLFLAFTGLGLFTYIFALRGQTPAVFYAVSVLLGFANGYWALFVTVSAEQFGTNLRATVATSAPNLVRGAVIPMTLGFQALAVRTGKLPAGLMLGILFIAIAFWALSGLRESFQADLDFQET